MIDLDRKRQVSYLKIIKHSSISITTIANDDHCVQANMEALATYRSQSSITNFITR